MRAISIASRLVGCLLLLGATAWAVQTPPPGSQPAPPAKTGDLPPELAMVPPDGLYFGHAQVEKILAHPVVLNLLKRLPPDLLKGIEKEMKVPDLGIGITDVANATLYAQMMGLVPEGMNGGLIIVTKKAYDRQKLLKGLLEDPVEKKAGDKVYYVRKPMENEFQFFHVKLHFVDDRRFVVMLSFGSGEDDPKIIEDRLATLYKKKAKGAQSETIAAAKDHLVIFGNNVPEEMRKLTEQTPFPPEMEWMKPLNQCEFYVTTLALDKTSTIRVHFRFPDAGKAKDAEEAIKHGRKYLLEQWEPILAEAREKAKNAKDPNDPAPFAVPLLLEVQNMLKTGQVQVRDKELTLLLSFRTDDAMMEQAAKFITATWKKEEKP